MAKPKKKRAKKYSEKARSVKEFQQAFRENLNQVWFAGGHCLTQVECEGVISDEHASYLLSKKQQWTVLIFAFCENDLQRYTKVKALPPFTTFITKDEIAKEIEKEIFEFCNQQNQKHLISPGYFMSPSIDVDLFAIRNDIIDRFAAWGAFDHNICDIAWGCKNGERGKRTA